VVVDGASAVRELTLRSRGDRVLLVGQTEPLMGLLTGAPLSLDERRSPSASGVARLASGTLRVAGHEVRKKAHLRAVGVAPRDPPLPSQWVGLDYLRWSARLRGAGRRASGVQAEAALEALGIGELRRRMLSAMSRPQRQALGLARALLGEPDTIVIDEPLHDLDGDAAALMLQLLDRACAGRAVLLSLPRVQPAATQSSLARSASDVCVIRDGRLLLHASPDELFASARLYEVTVAHGAEALRSTLASRGAELEGGPTHFSARTPATMGAGDILAAAAEARAAVVSCQPLLG
jgi:ABC-type multidrug transport system ATPase subunit